MADRVLISCPQMQVSFPAFEEQFRALGIEADLPPVEQALSEAELLEIIDRYDGVIAGDDEFTARVLERATRLRILSKWGVGVDGIDREAAARAGIPVTNTPGTFDGEVADVCIGYLVLLARGLHRLDAGVRAGGWPKIEGTSLAGKRLVIVGLGGIGSALARRAAAMEMTVIGCDADEGARDRALASGVDVRDLRDALAIADFLSLNCPLTPQSRHLVNSESLALMPRGAYVINTARGGLVDEAALVAALTSGQVAGAALDVLEREPPAADNPLRRFDTVIFGTHNASNTAEAVQRVSERAVDNLLRGLAAPA
ncbi:MAG: phosphoglycerate dehydrogenase [Frankia sp.]|nr:phosphoglycerate dehydrogenase [Frankia sp.]